MKTFTPLSRRGLVPLAAWAGAATLALGALFGATSASAAPPPANTPIGNQATASYVDNTGASQQATSNLVQTIVQQVGAFDLDTNKVVTTNVINTLTGAQGQPVYAPHVLTNDGNGTDNFTIQVLDNGAPKFSQVAIYADANKDGQPDSTTPLCATPAIGSAPLCSAGFTTNVAGNGGSFPFVVAYTILAGATTPTTPYDTGTVTAFPTNPSASGPDIYAGGFNGTPVGVAPYHAADVDNVNLTTVAAFNVTKAITVPAVPAAAAQGNWPAAPSSGPASLSTATCATAVPVATTTSCDYTVYTLTYKNAGGAAGAVYITDDLGNAVVPGTTGFTYVTGSAVWSSNGGVALNETGISSVTAGGSTATFAVDATGKKLAAKITNVGNNVSGTISFIVLVNKTAPVGTSLTTNKAMYSQLDATADVAPTTATAATVPADVTSPTNLAPFTVTPTYGVVLGSAVFLPTDGQAPTPDNNAATGALDTTAGTPNGLAKFDLETTPTIVAGGTTKFMQTVFNTGNAADTFNLTFPANTFPAGTTFQFYAADGVTPLLDTNSDMIPDTGSIPAGGSKTFVVVVGIPGSTPVGAGAFTVNVLATSVNDTAAVKAKDATQDQVLKVVGAIVDLTNTTTGNGTAGTTGNGDVGPGPSPLPTTTNTTPAGTVAAFSLFITNNDSKANTYDLAASQTTSFPGSLPAGWTVKFVDAALAVSTTATPAATITACAAGPFVTNIAVPAAPVAPTLPTPHQYTACVTPPASAPAAPTPGINIYFQVKSTANASTGVIVSDAKTDAVIITPPNTFGDTFSPNNTGQVTPGGTVVYAHTITATGAQNCGTYILNATLPAADAAAGWTVSLFSDVNGNGTLEAAPSGVDTPLTNPSAASAPLMFSPLTPQKILVKVFAPGGAVAGVTDTVTITATFAAEATTGNICPTTTVTDTSTVVTGQIRAVKQQVLVPATCTPAGVCTCGALPSAPGWQTALITNAKPGDCLYYQVVATNQGTSPVTNLSVSDAAPAYTTLLPQASQPVGAAGCSSTGVTGTAVAYSQSTTTAACGSSPNSVPPGASATLVFGVQIAN